ncbi:MAG: hypothetical protein L3J39_10355 [Verrucomicrobiales bacterium]|nr:hypothetical protein [Verrucomicrobiales bacterium]
MVTVQRGIAIIRVMDIELDILLIAMAVVVMGIHSIAGDMALMVIGLHMEMGMELVMVFAVLIGTLIEGIKSFDLRFS